VTPAAPSGGIPAWRIAAGFAVLAVLLALSAALAPVYWHNLQLQSFVAAMTQTASGRTAPDDDVRARVVAKARSLNLSVTEDEVHITRRRDGLRIDVPYFVTVNLPGYTVNLHFHSDSGTR
jgi:hypothetical protein